jgi:type II secretory pathway component GspD/PulD (secretin)
MNKRIALSTIAAAVCISPVCFAQDAKPKATPFKWSAPLRTFNVSPSPSQKDTFDVNASLAPIDDVLQSIARQANLKVVVSDEAKLLIPDVRLRQMTGHEAIQSIATRCGLSWGKVGQDMYLVVPTRPKAPVKPSDESVEEAVTETAD